MAKGKKTGGRTAGTPNKANAELRTFACKYTKEAINGLLAIARSGEMPPQARVGAWREILDRAVGKAPQAVTDADGNNLPAIPPAIEIVFRQQPDSENRT